MDSPLVLLERPGLDGLAEPEGLGPQLGVRPVVALVTRARDPFTHLHPPSRQEYDYHLAVLRIRIRDLGPGIRCLFDPWIRDWFFPNPGSDHNV